MNEKASEVLFRNCDCICFACKIEAFRVTHRMVRMQFLFSISLFTKICRSRETRDRLQQCSCMLPASFSAPYVLVKILLDHLSKIYCNNMLLQCILWLSSICEFE